VLVKMLVINDMRAMGITDINRTFMSVASEAAREMELVYPQLMAANVIVNAPTFLRWLA
jgi:hypothetical protein